MMLAAYKAVFFDAGGTLFRPYPSVGDLYHEVAKRYECHASREQIQESFLEIWRKRSGMTKLASHSNEKVERDWWRHLVHEVFAPLGGVQDFEDFFDELYDLFARPQTWKLYPDVIEVLKKLKKENKKLGIISNWDSRLFQLCRGLAVEPYFDFVLASAVFGASKPGPKIFQEALRLAGVRAEEAVHVGDSLDDDIHGALGAGLHAVWIERNGRRSGLPASAVSQNRSVSLIRKLGELVT